MIAISQVASTTVILSQKDLDHMIPLDKRAQPWIFTQRGLLAGMGPLLQMVRPV